MDIIKILQRELLLINTYSPLVKLFNLILFIWVMSIPAKNSLYQVSVILIPAICIFHFLFKNEYRTTTLYFVMKYRSYLLAFFFILLAMVFANLQNDLSNADSWARVGKFFSRYILVLFSLLYLYEKSFFTKKTLVIFILISLIMYGLHGVYQILFVNKGAESIQSVLYNRNPFALIMFAGIVITTLCMRYFSREKSTAFSVVVTWIALAIFVVSLLFSYSRSAWLATALFVTLLILNNKKLFLQSRKTIFTLLPISITILYFNEGLANRFISLIQLHDPNRIAIWKNTVLLIQEKVFWGYGLIDYSSIGLTKYAGVHNSTLEILLFTGMLGLFAFLITILLTAKEIFISKNHEYFPVFLSLILISQFNFSVISNKIFLSVLTLFLFFVLAHRAENNSKQQGSLSK